MCLPDKTDNARYGGLDPKKPKKGRMEWKTEKKKRDRQQWSAGCLQKSDRESVRTSGKASHRAPLDCASGYVAQTPETPFASSSLTVENERPEVDVGLPLRA